MINVQAIKIIYKYEMLRAWNTIMQSFISPVISTVLYFVVFGSAIGSRIETVEGVSYGAFIVPGLVMLALLAQSVANASFGIYFPRFTGTIYEVLSAPVSFVEILLGYVGAAASKSFIIGMIILATSGFLVDLNILHPFWMLSFLVLTCISFSLLGFIIGLWADNFEKLQLIPMLVITPWYSWEEVFIPLTCCPPSGGQSACSTRWCTWSVDFAGVFMKWPMSVSKSAC